MNAIQRWTNEFATPDENGGWVRWEDHHAALSESEAAATEYLRQLREVVGIVNDDDGPPEEEYANGDAKTGVLLVVARAEKAEAALAELRRDNEWYQDRTWDYDGFPSATAAMADVQRLVDARDKAEAALDASHEQVASLRATVAELEAGLKATMADLAASQAEVEWLRGQVSGFTSQRDWAVSGKERAELDCAEAQVARNAALARERALREALAELVEAMRLWGAEEDGIPEQLGRASKPFAAWENAKALLSGAAPSPACPSCERMRGELASARVIARVLDAKRKHAAQSLLEIVGVLGSMVAEGNGDKRIARAIEIAERGMNESDAKTVVPTRLGPMAEVATAIVPRDALRSEAEAALAHAEGTKEAHKTCDGCKYDLQGFQYPCDHCNRALVGHGEDRWTARATHATKGFV